VDPNNPALRAGSKLFPSSRTKPQETGNNVAAEQEEHREQIYKADGR
jgi:hypothetical protein